MIDVFPVFLLIVCNLKNFHPLQCIVYLALASLTVQSPMFGWCYNCTSADVRLPVGCV